MKKVTNTSENPHPTWLFGGNPGAIERQESQGQKEVIESQQLPKKSNPYSDVDASAQYESMGIKVVGESKGDNLFLDVVLPKGWKKQATDHSMWNHLVDDKGRKRAMFFYKAAFYDRDAFINFLSRYEIATDYSDDKTRMYFVKDTATSETLFSSERVPKENAYDMEEKLRKDCVAYLESNYPDWKNSNAYWD